MRNFNRQFLLKISIPKEDLSSYTNTIIVGIPNNPDGNLRIAFSISKMLAWAGNPGVIKIWNLSADIRNQIQNFGCKVELHAGYQDNGGLQLLYLGYTNTVSHEFSLPEIVTTLECTDASRWAISGNNTKGSVSYAAGSLAIQIIKDCAERMGIALANLPFFQNLAYPYGFKGCYLFKEIIVKVCSFLNIQPCYENDILYLYPLEFTKLTGLPVANVNEATGMIGIPQRFTNQKQDTWKATYAPQTGYRVNMVLTPLIIPGNVISLSSNHLGIQNQNHVVQTIRHNGDTYGPEWISNIELTRQQ